MGRSCRGLPIVVPDATPAEHAQSASAAAMLAKWPSACCGIRVQTSHSQLPWRRPFIEGDLCELRVAHAGHHGTPRIDSLDGLPRRRHHLVAGGSGCSTAIFAFRAMVTSQLCRCGPLFNVYVFDSSWEATEAMHLDVDPAVTAWVKNDTSVSKSRTCSTASSRSTARISSCGSRTTQR